MKKIKYIISLLILFTGLHSESKADDGVIPNIMSPDVATLGKYGAFPVSYYTGTPDISVPLYSIKLRDREIPIYISYDASGFLPNRDAGIVGQNWSLMAGGIITRTVNGIPDEQSGSSISGLSPNYLRYGYWYGIKQRGTPKNGDFIKNLSYFNPTGSTLMNLDYEHTPDLFFFNFCGHSGKFLIGNDGLIKVIADEAYKVDLSGLTYQTDNTSIKPSTIKIIANDGYEFTFGGSLSSVEINFNFDSEASSETIPIPSSSGVINSWYLTKIKSPNGEETDFIYEDQEEDLYWFLFRGGYHGEDRQYLEKSYYINDTYSGYYFTKTKTSELKRPANKRLSFIKKAYLKKIDFPLGKILLDYSVKEKSFYGNQRFLFWNTTGRDSLTKKIDMIKVYDSSDELKKQISFSYSYNASSNSSCYRMFLDGLKINDESYRFDYYIQSGLPQPLTCSIDFWGYYNGNTSQENSLLPATGSVSNPTSPFEVDVSFRKTDKTYNNIGMLSKITYPTGGTSEFTFETHEYGTVYRRSKASGLNPGVQAESGYAGGVRIKQIKNTPGNSINFYYKKNFNLGTRNDSGNSSGILIDYNIYHANLIYYFNSSTGDIAYFTINSNNILSSGSIQESHIGYSEVTTVVNNGEGGYTNYHYTSHITNPDKYNLGSGTYAIHSNLAKNIDFEAQMKRLIKYSSCEGERGKLSKKIEYNSMGNSIRSEEYKYNEQPNRFNQAVYVYHLPFWEAYQGIYQSYAIYYYPNHLMQKKTVEYIGGSQTELVENYIYDDTYHLLKETNFSTSTGDIIFNIYKYPVDFSSLSPYDNMVKMNIISPIVEKSVFKNGNQFIDMNITNYKFFHSRFYAPENSQVRYPDGTKETRQKYDYDQKNNMREIIKDNSDPVVYLWGYNSQYPIAEIKGVDYSRVVGVLGQTQIDNLASSNNPDIVTLSSTLRNAFQSPSQPVLVTCYAYKPLVGIIRSIDPRGVSTTYEYDSFGRLIKTAHDGVATNLYEYHYKTQ